MRMRDKQAFDQALRDIADLKARLEKLESKRGPGRPKKDKPSDG